MNKFVRDKFIDWITFSILLPFLLPIFIGWLGTLFVPFDTSIVLFLFKKGCYNFLGMFILLNLFQDYDMAKRVFNKYVFLIIIAGILAQSCLCISALLPQSENLETFENNTRTFLIVSVSTLIFSTIYKLVVLREKYNYNTKKLEHGNT
jgi:hypothetical protein